MHYCILLFFFAHLFLFLPSFSNMSEQVEKVTVVFVSSILGLMKEQNWQFQTWACKERSLFFIRINKGLTQPILANDSLQNVVPFVLCIQCQCLYFRQRYLNAIRENRQGFLFSNFPRKGMENFPLQEYNFSPLLPPHPCMYIITYTTKTNIIPALSGSLAPLSHQSTLTSYPIINSFICALNQCFFFPNECYLLGIIFHF